MVATVAPMKYLSLKIIYKLEVLKYAILVMEWVENLHLKKIKNGYLN